MAKTTDKMAGVETATISEENKTTAPSINNDIIDNLNATILSKDTLIHELEDQVASLTGANSSLSDEVDSLRAQIKSLKAASKTPEPTATQIPYAHGRGARVIYPAHHSTAKFIVTSQVGSNHLGFPLYNITGDGFDAYYSGVSEEELMRS